MEKSQQPKTDAQLPSSKPIFWANSHQEALEYLIDCLTKPPVMAYPDFSSLFIFHTDVSEVGLGAVLYQRQNGKPPVIAYGSSTLTPAEKNYHHHSGKLEFLALKWAVCDPFCDYLYYAPTFTVYTDNNPLTYAKLNATGLQWVEELADFNFNIKYRLGKVHKDADTLSRMPLDFESYMKVCTEETTQETLNAIVSSVQLQDQGESTWLTALTSDPSIPSYDINHISQ